MLVVYTGKLFFLKVRQKRRWSWKFERDTIEYGRLKIFWKLKKGIFVVIFKNMYLTYETQRFWSNGILLYGLSTFKKIFATNSCIYALAGRFQLNHCVSREQSVIFIDVWLIIYSCVKWINKYVSPFNHLFVRIFL